MTRAAVGFDGASGIRLAADTFGAPDAPAVLMLHGYPGAEKSSEGGARESAAYAHALDSNR